MNDFLPLDQADQLIAELAGERVFAGRSKRMAQAGKLKISFHYRGPIGVFAPPEKPDEKPRAIKKYSFNGHLCAVAQPVLDVPTEEISSEGIKELHIDYLIAREVTLAEGSLPIELEPGQFIGRLNTKIVHTDGNKRIRHAMDHLNSASVPERKWRIASDEIRAVFQKPTSTTTTPADGLGQGTKGKKRSRKPSWHSVSMKYMKDLYQSGNYKSSPAFYRALLLHVGKPNSPFAKTSGGALFCIEAGTEVAEGTVGTKWAEIRG